jgi:putative transposase
MVCFFYIIYRMAVPHSASYLEFATNAGKVFGIPVRHLKEKAMANTHTEIHIHTVFPVKYRAAAIRGDWEANLYSYMGGILKNHGHKPLAINGMPDHVHMLFGMRPTQSLSDLMQDIKGSSSAWINKNRLTRGRFQWQEGFGAFAVSKRYFPVVADYIEAQKDHHRRRPSFREEYVEILKENEAEFDERYIFTDPD